MSYLIFTQRDFRPAIAIGFRDIGGTGIYSGEYIVAEKTLSKRVTTTVGIGWGRFAGRGQFTNPLSILDDKFESRPDATQGGLQASGQLDTGSWFRGDAALFGGIVYTASERLRFALEYSSDAYLNEQQAGHGVPKSPINGAVSFAWSDNLDISAYTLGGTQFGIQLSFSLDPSAPLTERYGSAPSPLRPLAYVAAASWNLPKAASDVHSVLEYRLSIDGLILLSLEQRSQVAELIVDNAKHQFPEQAIGRAMRAMANTLPAEITAFVVTVTTDGIPVSALKIPRSQFVSGEFATSDERVFPRVTKANAPHFKPSNSFALGPYWRLSLFDPDAPFRYEIGLSAEARIGISLGTSVSLQIDDAALSTFDDATRRSNSVLPHVRSDWALYAQTNNPRISRLTLDHHFRLSDDLFGRFSAGYFEQMYAGVSAEVLWHPLGASLSFGAEINWLQQRDFDGFLGLRDYNIWSGHASAYADFGDDYELQLDLGRYLAGDWGATFHVKRAFANGVKVGAFATLTDVSFTDFGEGSFDKGISFEIPISWLSGRPSSQTATTIIRPVYRDGGARVNIPSRLYQTVHKNRTIGKNWEAFYR